jgi:hypothetical protein
VATPGKAAISSLAARDRLLAQSNQTDAGPGGIDKNGVAVLDGGHSVGVPGLAITPYNYSSALAMTVVFSIQPIKS